MKSRPEPIELTEYRPVLLPAAGLSANAGELLWRKYNKYVNVDFPSPKTKGQWELTPQGYVGYLPLNDEIAFHLKPKVELTNLFRMLEYVYNLETYFARGDFDCAALLEFYESLAGVLARRILARNRKGLYRAYVQESDSLPYIRGRLEQHATLRLGWDVNNVCHYEDHTADVEENQILAWTLWRIARSGLCSRALPVVVKAYRALQGFASLTPFRAEACVGRLYNRLNDDYYPLHALCRFFLEHTGPSYAVGDRAMVPFLVDMPTLYERFVAAWLRKNQPQGLEFKAQENVHIDADKSISFDIDLVLKSEDTGETVCVFDTKYKAADKPSNEDISQVVTYAEAKGCKEAALIYPADLARPLDVKIGGIRVRSITFALAGDLDEEGQAFLNQVPQQVRATFPATY